MASDNERDSVRLRSDSEAISGEEEQTKGWSFWSRGNKSVPNNEGGDGTLGIDNLVSTLASNVYIPFKGAENDGNDYK